MDNKYQQEKHNKWHVVCRTGTASPSRARQFASGF